MRQSRNATANEAVLLLDELGSSDEQYREWLEPRYSIHIAQSVPDAVQCLQRASTDVVIFGDTGFRDTVTDFSRRLATTDGHYQTIVATARRAFAETDWHTVDECLHPPVDRDGVVSCVERASLVAAYDAVVAALLSIGPRLAVLREGVTPDRMESSAEFRRLTDRIETLHQKLETLHETLCLRADVDPLTRAKYDLSPGEFDWA